MKRTHVSCQLNHANVHIYMYVLYIYNIRISISQKKRQNLIHSWIVWLILRVIAVDHWQSFFSTKKMQQLPPSKTWGSRLHSSPVCARNALGNGWRAPRWFGILVISALNVAVFGVSMLNFWGVFINLTFLFSNLYYVNQYCNIVVLMCLLH